MDPLLEIKNAYFNTKPATAPDQNFTEILDFRKAFQCPEEHHEQRRYLRLYQSTIRTTKFIEEYFHSAYAFYRVDKRWLNKEKKCIKVICYPLHFETAVGEDFKHLGKVFLNQSSEDLHAKFSTTTFNQLLVGDIVALAELWKWKPDNRCKKPLIFAAEYVCFERRVKTSDALIYRLLYDKKNEKDRKKKVRIKFLASSVDIPQDYASAVFEEPLENPEFGGLHAIGRCEIFIPIKGVQRFSANFANDILHPDPLIRQSCIIAHKNAQIYRSFRQMNYKPLVLNYTKKNSFTRHRDEFTTIDEVLKNGDQKQVYNLCTMVSASLEHHKMFIKSLDARNHALKIVEWKIKDNVDYQIEIKFTMKKIVTCNKNTRIPKNAMMKVYGILPIPLELFIEYHFATYYDQDEDEDEVEEENEPEKIEDIIILKTVLHIMDNIPETEDEESVARKMYLEVLESLESESEFIYGHLISGETKDPSFVRKFGKNLSDSFFNEIMRNSRNIEGPPQFDYIPDLDKEELIKDRLKAVINMEPTKEQIETVYYAIHAKNPMMSVEAPVGGGKTTTLAASCCIAAEYYQLRQLIVSESNGAVVAVCRKLAEFGAIKVLRVTSMVAQRRTAKMLTTDYDLPTVAERVFLEVLQNFDKDPNKERSSEELDIIQRCYRMLNYMHQTSSQSRFHFENIEKLRELFGYSIDSAPEDPTREKVELVFQLVEPDIILGTATQIEQLLEHHKSIDLNVDMINIDNASVESIYSLFTLVSMLTTEVTKKIILYGDSRQFVPECINRAIRFQFRTAMDVVGHGLARIKLNKMFRFQPDTAKILSNVFYARKEFKIATSSSSIHLPDTIWPNPRTSLDFKFVEGQHYGERYTKNDEEALEIQRMCENLIESGVQKSDIIILAFYNGQVQHLKRHLKGYTILTVRSSQGLEAKIVLVSVARTEKPKERSCGNWIGPSSMRTPITEELQFILVALSRAREKCLFFIDPEYAKRGKWSEIIKQINYNY